MKIKINYVSLIESGVVKRSQLKTGVVDDPCSKCEEKKGEEVCGDNGKTYNTLCHAVNCAGLKEDDISDGPCEQKVCPFRSTLPILK